MWLSWVAMIVTAVLAYHGFRKRLAGTLTDGRQSVGRFGNTPIDT
jgi:hypothetical protein